MSTEPAETFARGVAQARAEVEHDDLIRATERNDWPDGLGVCQESDPLWWSACFCDDREHGYPDRSGPRWSAWLARQDDPDGRGHVVRVRTRREVVVVTS